MKKICLILFLLINSAACMAKGALIGLNFVRHTCGKNLSLWYANLAVVEAQLEEFKDVDLPDDEDEQKLIKYQEKSFRVAIKLINKEIEKLENERGFIVIE